MSAARHGLAEPSRQAAAGRAPASLLVVRSIGLILLSGGAGGGTVRLLAREFGNGPIGWTFVVASGLAAVAFATWIVTRWWRRLSPAAEPGTTASAGAWCLAAAAGGAGCGVYAGGLEAVDPAFAIVMLLFLPVVMLAEIGGAPPGAALGRVAITMICMEVASQIAWTTWDRYGRAATITDAHARSVYPYGGWDDITLMNAAWFAGAFVLVLIHAPWQRRFSRWLDSLPPLRREATGEGPPPRRA